MKLDDEHIFHATKNIREFNLEIDFFPHNEGTRAFNYFAREVRYVWINLINLIGRIKIMDPPYKKQ